MPHTAATSTGNQSQLPVTGLPPQELQHWPGISAFQPLFFVHDHFPLASPNKPMAFSIPTGDRILHECTWGFAGGRDAHRPGISPIRWGKPVIGKERSATLLDDPQFEPWR